VAQEYALFKNAYFDAISDNFMTPAFDELALKGPIQSALDVGCGNGLFGAYLKKKTGCRLTGIDASEFGLAEAKKAGYDETRLCGDLCAEPLPFPDASFDFVLCKDLLEHLIDPLALLREIRRVLKPGGRVLSLVPNHFTLAGRFKFLFTNDLDTYDFFPTAHEWDFPHIRFYSRPGFLALHAEAGFSESEDLGRHFYARVPKLWRAPGYNALLGALHRAFPSSFTTAHVALFEARR
jgi:SAM-dependent methyltransferase